MPANPGGGVARVGAAQAGDHGDGELQTLGGMDRHDPQRILAFVSAELDPIDVVDAPIHPRQVLGQGATGRVAPGAGLVDHVANPPPCLAGHLLAFVQRRGNATPVVVQLGDQLGGCSLVFATAELLDRAQRVADDPGLVREHSVVVGKSCRR